MAARKGTRKGKRKATKRRAKKTIEQRVTALEKAITPASSKRGGRKVKAVVIAQPNLRAMTPPHVLRQLGMA